MFLSCVFINFIFVFLTSGQDCNSGMQKRIHFRTDMEHNIYRPLNNSDVSLGYQFCKNITFILYIIYNVRFNKKYYSTYANYYSYVDICQVKTVTCVIERNIVSLSYSPYFELPNRTLIHRTLASNNVHVCEIVSM